MGRELVAPSFEEWLTWVFDHPVTEPAWFFDLEADWWDEERDPERAVEYLTRLWEQPLAHTAGYADAQIAQGLRMLVSPDCSNLVFVLLEARVPWEARRRALRAIPVVYGELFAARCVPSYRYGRWSKLPPLDSICFMWWDGFPDPPPGHPEAALWEAECLGALERILELPSAACQEAALHGLSHFKGYDEEVRSIVDRYLAGRPNLGRELREYALAARTKSVL